MISDFLNEEEISYSTKPGTMSLWHGGRLDDEYSPQRNGRYEFGAGLYLTTNWTTAMKYAKGRRLYMVTIEKGNDMADKKIPISDVNKFISSEIIGRLRTEVKERMDEYIDEIGASIFNNIILNEKAIKSTRTNALREFLVSQGIDYHKVHNAFGWGETMIVLFNMDKIIDKKAVGYKDKIVTFDLPTEFQ